MSVTLMAAAVFLLASANVGRVVFTLSGWGLWSSLGQPFSPGLRAATSAVWSLGLGGTAWGLWVRRRWARRWALVLLPLYHLTEFGWRVAFASSDYERGRLPFVFVAASLATLAAVWILTRRRVRETFEMASKMEGDSQ